MNLKSRSLWRNSRYLNIVLVIIGMGYAGYNILQPFLHRWVMVHKNIHSARMKIKKNSSILKEKERIESECSNYVTSIDSGTDGLPWLMRKIDIMAADDFVQILDLKPKSDKKRSLYQRYFVILSAKGNIAQLAGFLLDLESSSLMLNRLNINAVDESGILRLDAEISTPPIYQLGIASGFALAMTERSSLRASAGSEAISEHADLLNGDRVFTQIHTRRSPQAMPDSPLKSIRIKGIIHADIPQVIVKDDASSNTYILKKDEYIGEVRLKDINQGKAIFEWMDEEYEISL